MGLRCPPSVSDVWSGAYAGRCLGGRGGSVLFFPPLDQNAGAANAGHDAGLSDGNAHPARVEVFAQEFGDVFGERLEQAEMLAGQFVAQPLDDSGVIDRVTQIVAASRVLRREANLQGNLNRLRHALFARINAD